MIIKWAGGKRAILNKIKPFFPAKFNNYYEPFFGGGAVFFGINTEKAFISDTNENLITTYEQIRDNHIALISELKALKAKHCKDFYYEMRAKATNNDIDTAARFIYLNKTCFNGLYRVNSKNLFNVPIGSYKDPVICDEPEIVRISNLLQNVDIKHQTFDKISPSKDDFVYFDPPYHNTFTSYNKDKFDESQQIKLANLFFELKAKGVYVVLSNSDTAFIRDLYKNATIEDILAPRVINSKKTNRQPVIEVLIH